MLSSLAAHQLYHYLDALKIFEEMDRAQLEVLFLEHQELESSSFATWQKLTGICGIFGISGIFIKPQKMTVFGAILGGITVVGGTVAVGWMWWRGKMSEVKKAIGQMERTKMALRRRRQIYFSISNRLPSTRTPLMARACRITVQSIDILIEESRSMSVTSWIDLYTPEMLRITAKMEGNSEKLEIEEQDEEHLDFEVVFETLIAMFKLHISEYSRFLISQFLTENSNFRRKFWRFLRILKSLKENRLKLEEIEKLALKGEASKNRQKLIKTENLKNLELGWKEKIGMAMEAILEGLKTNNLNRNEVELALRRALLIVGSSEATSSGNSDENSENQKKASEEGIQNIEEDVNVFEKRERTDVDMVFEGISLSEAEKRSGIGRDVLLDGSEAKKHEKSLFGELKMVLEPRRNDFLKREKKALAKFYGVEENELEEEKEEQKEENFEGVGLGDDSEEPEPYDWRKEAENSMGLHLESDNIDFLNALASRRVRDDVIE